MPVASLKNVLTKSEYYGWVQYFHFQPPDPHEVQLATLISTLLNALSKKGNAKTEDFIISYTDKGPTNKFTELGYQVDNPDDMSDYLKHVDLPPGM